MGSFPQSLAALEMAAFLSGRDDGFVRGCRGFPRAPATTPSAGDAEANAGAAPLPKAILRSGAATLRLHPKASPRGSPGPPSPPRAPPHPPPLYLLHPSPRASWAQSGSRSPSPASRARARSRSRSAAIKRTVREMEYNEEMSCLFGEFERSCSHFRQARAELARAGVRVHARAASDVNKTMHKIQRLWLERFYAQDRAQDHAQDSAADSAQTARQGDSTQTARSSTRL